jgi:predicted DNA-binding protein
MQTPKAMTIRLAQEQAEQLETVAAVEGRPVSEVVRSAIAGHIDQRREDRDFQDGLRARIERAQKMVK